DAPWLTAPASSAVMAALGEAFFVGGCVRNQIMDRPVADIDIATPLVPDEVARRLAAAEIKTVPTGLKHGTQTAVVRGEGVEITTFRTDIETDGRHAVVNFTTDIAEDAARRDFTMNALYAAVDGTIIDPVDGYRDAIAGRLRFIGQAEDRIREDYLRILRFFRFQALYGRDGIDADGLAACAALAGGLDRIARERVGWEMRKLLGAPDPAPSVASMAASGVLMRVLPGADPALLAPLVHVEGESGAEPDWLTRLAALGGEDTAAALKLSKAEQEGLEQRRAALAEPDPAIAAYRHGAVAARSAQLLMQAAGSAPDRHAEEKIARGAMARLPLTAGDLMGEGWESGPDLGAALRRAEAIWIESGFMLDRVALLARLGAA
ncbi:MAG: CCA tRNA nucleotidyltransferase, partial [Pseudomonadota bacterium]